MSLQGGNQIAAQFRDRGSEAAITEKGRRALDRLGLGRRVK
jgi:hypothetical protein